MALIPIFPEDMVVNSIKVHPSQSFASSSNGISGKVFLFAERPSSVKQVTDQLEEYIFDIQDSIFVDTDGKLKNRYGPPQLSSEVDPVTGEQNLSIKPQMQAYFTAISSLSSSLKDNKQLSIYRFNMPHRFNANTVRKSIYVKNLLPFYTAEYEKPLNFGFTNYHSLNFFTSSAKFPSGVPSDSALVYPVPTLDSKPSRYFPSGSFSYEFYINPRYTTDTGNDSYDPGTILHLPNCYCISIVSGTQKDELGRPTSFRLALQLNSDSQRPTKLFNFNNTDTDIGRAAQQNVTFPRGDGTNITTQTFLSEDGHILKDNWSYCAIRWGGLNQERYTGNFYINGKRAGTFKIPNTEISLRENFSNDEDIPFALVVGNHYQATSADLEYDNDDRIEVLSGSVKNSFVPITSGSGTMDVNLRLASNGNLSRTRKIFFTKVAENAEDTVLLENTLSAHSLAARLVNAINGDSVNRATIKLTGINNVGGQVKISVTLNSNAIANSPFTFTAVDSAVKSTYNSLGAAEFRNSTVSDSASDLVKKINATAGLSTYVHARLDSTNNILLRAIPPQSGNLVVQLQDGDTPLVKRSLSNFSLNNKLDDSGNGFISSLISQNINESVIDLNLNPGLIIDISQKSDVRVTPEQRAEGASGNFLSEIFRVSSENSKFGNYNSTVNKTAFLFDSGSATNFGVEKLLQTSTNENIRHVFDAPLNAELQEIRIFSKYRSDEDIKHTSENGFYGFKDKDLLFYLPPYFVPGTADRRMLFTVSQTHFSSSYTPFNLNTSFGQGGRMLNLENYTYDFVNMVQARCHRLAATPPKGTFQNFDADDFDFIPATDAIYIRPENRKRNLTILPSDLGNLDPKFVVLDKRAEDIVRKFLNNESAVDVKSRHFTDDAGIYDPGFISVKNIIDLDAKYSSLTEADLDSDRFTVNPNGIASTLTPIEPSIAFSETEDPSAAIDAALNDASINSLIDFGNGAASDSSPIQNDPSSVYGSQSSLTLTVLDRTRDTDSNEITFLDISNIFYGDLIKRESLKLVDDFVTGSAGKIRLSFKDSGYGNLYRCDTSGSHPIWSSVGNVLYEEGLICLTNPTIPNFGSRSFNINFNGDRNIHVLELRVPISSEEASVSTNSSFVDLAPTNLPSDSQMTCNLITNMNIHDENLNVIGKINLSRPIVRKENDKYVFKFKIDF